MRRVDVEAGRVVEVISEARGNYAITVPQTMWELTGDVTGDHDLAAAEVIALDGFQTYRVGLSALRLVPESRALLLHRAKAGVASIKKLAVEFPMEFRAQCRALRDMDL